MFPSSEKISAIIVAGGCVISSAEILAGDWATKKLPNLPKEISYSSMILHNGQILMCGGWNNELKCLQLNHGNWMQHSKLTKYRLRHSAATLQSASFVFGGFVSQERPVYSCAFIPHTNKIMISGGHDASEILDTLDGSVTMASPMNFGRQGHGMGVLTIDGEERLVVFGGDDGDRKHDSVELYNTKTDKWETTNIKLKMPRNDFGFLKVKLSDIISKSFYMEN